MNAREHSRFQAVFDNMTEGVVIANLDGQLVYWNRAALEMHGFAESAVCPPNLADCVGLIQLTTLDGQVLDIEHWPMSRLLRGENIRNYRLRLRRLDVDCARVFSYGGNVIEDPTGQRVAFLTMADITEQIKNETELRESREMLQGILNLIPLGVFWKDRNSRYLGCNSIVCHALGFAHLQDVVGRSDLEMPSISTEQASSFLAKDREVMDTNTPRYHVVEQLTRADGTTAWLDTNKIPIHDENGRVTGILGTWEDITQRKQAESTLHAVQERLQRVVATSPAVLFTLGFNGDSLALVWISDNVQQMMGYTVAEAFAPNWWRDRVHPADLEAVLTEIKVALTSKDGITQEYRFRHRDGNYRWIRSELKVLRDPQGRPLEIVGSWSDITEPKQLEEQFRQAQKMEAFGQLAGGVAHDFNNLLTIITGFSEMILSGIIPSNKHLEMVGEIRKAGERAASLTRQLLAFSRKQILQPVWLDLNGLVNEMEKMLGRLIGEDIDLATALDPALGPVKADPGQIEQMIMNLAINARDAMPRGGQLTIETRNVELDAAYCHDHVEAKPGSYAMLAVTDSGCGMDKVTRAKIFEPFFTTKEVGKGTGLGLATVHGIVKQSGGSIEVYTEVGRGTTFKIYLPLAMERPSSRKSFPGTVVMPRGKETILLAEDEDAVRATVRLALETQGYCVLEARDGEHALEVSNQAQGTIDLLMTDVVMPRLSGRNLASSITASRPQIKVLFLSGYTDDAIVRHGVLEAGAAFLQKPFTPIVLARKVREVLDA